MKQAFHLHIRSVFKYHGSFRIIIEILLVLSVYFIYSPSLQYEFVWDDNDYITQNPHVNTGLTRKNIVWALTASYSGNWHPVTWVSHQLDCYLYGLKPSGHHLTNIVLHICCVIILLHICIAAGLSLSVSTIITALFAFHPLNVETITWVSQRKSLLCMFFMLLSMWMYIKCMRHNHPSLIFFSLTFFIFAVCSKPLAVSLPFLLFLLDWWPLQRITSIDNTIVKQGIGKLIVEKIPFVLLSILLSVMAVMAQSSGGAVKSLTEIPLLNRVANSFVLYWRYIYKIIFPVDLIAFYPYSGIFPLWKIVVSLISTIAVFVLVIIGSKRIPGLLTGWCWFIIALVPMIGIVQIGGQSIADRYAYLPEIGIYIIIVMTGSYVFKGRFASLASISIGGVILTFIVLTYRQQSYWKDTFSLYNRMITVAPSSIAHVNIAAEYFKKGDCARTEYHYLQAMQLDGAKMSTVVFLINALMKCNQWDKAKSAVSSALKQHPNSLPFMTSQAWILSKTGKPNEALRSLKNILINNPDNMNIHMLTALVAKQQNDFSEAIDQFSWLIDHGQNTMQHYYNRAEMYVANKQYDLAKQDIDILLKINPNDTLVRQLDNKCHMYYQGYTSPY